MGPSPTPRATAAALAAVLLLAAHAGHAEAQVRFSGGYDLTSFFGGGAGDSGSRSSLGLGASAGLFAAGPVIFIAEGWYRQKGATSVEEFNEQVFEEGAADIGLDYVEIPILVRVNLPTIGDRFVPYVNAGPAFGWQIDCGIRFTRETGTAEQSCEDLEGENLEETLRDFEQGLALGGGVDVVILGGAGAINIDARLTRGLSRITQSEAEGAEVRNQAFSVMLGYSFGVPGGLGVPGR